MDNPRAKEDHEQDGWWQDRGDRILAKNDSDFFGLLGVGSKPAIELEGKGSACFYAEVRVVKVVDVHECGGVGVGVTCYPADKLVTELTKAENQGVLASHLPDRLSKIPKSFFCSGPYVSQSENPIEKEKLLQAAMEKQDVEVTNAEGKAKERQDQGKEGENQGENGSNGNEANGATNVAKPGPNNTLQIPAKKHEGPSSTTSNDLDPENKIKEGRGYTVSAEKTQTMANTTLVKTEEKERHLGVYVNSTRMVRFMYSHAQTKNQKVPKWKVGDSMSVWVRKMDVSADDKEPLWLFSVYINYNRITTAAVYMPSSEQDLKNIRIVCEGLGNVRGLQLISTARPPNRLALSWWFNPQKYGVQPIVESIQALTEFRSMKQKFKVDWTMAVSTGNILHKESKQAPILCWQQIPLESSLTYLPLTERGLCLKCHRLIHLIMGDVGLASTGASQTQSPSTVSSSSPSSSKMGGARSLTGIEREKCIFALFWYFKNRPSLRDEIILALIKQLTLNPGRQSTLIGYVLLNIIMEGASESHYRLPVLVEDFLRNQTFIGDKELQEAVESSYKVYRKMNAGKRAE